MKRRYLLLVLACCLLSAVFLFSCGSGPGAPGSSGSEDTGIEIQSVSIVPNKTTGGDAGPDLDTATHICSDGKPEPEGGLFRVDATMTIAAAKLNPLTPGGSTTTVEPFPATVQQCTITYMRPVDNPGAPVIDQWTVFPNCPLVDGSNTCIVDLIDITRKDKFWSDILTESNSGLGVAALPVHYVANYKCIYMNAFGQSGRFEVNLDIFLADFNTCTQ